MLWPYFKQTIINNWNIWVMLVVCRWFVYSFCHFSGTRNILHDGCYLASSPPENESHSNLRTASSVPRHFHTTAHHVTLALWLNIYFASYYYCLSYWQVKVCVCRRKPQTAGKKRCEMETWGNSCRETFEPRGCISVHQAPSQSVFILSCTPLRFGAP